MSSPAPAGADPAGGIPPLRQAAAVLITLASAVVAVLAATGVLVAGCADGCPAGQLAGQVGIALLTLAAVGALGWLGIVAARRSWGWLGCWVLGMAVLARAAEFVLVRL